MMDIELLGGGKSEKKAELILYAMRCAIWDGPQRSWFGAPTCVEQSQKCPPKY